MPDNISPELSEVGRGQETEKSSGSCPFAVDWKMGRGGSVDVVEDFLGLEEALDFDFCAFGGVGSVADVEHAVGAVVAADGAFISLHGVGGPEDAAHAGDDAGAGEHEGDHGAGLHEVRQGGEQGLVINNEVDDVGVVFAQDGVVELHHLHAAEAEAFGQEALQDDTGEVLADAVRLEKNKGFFVAIHNEIRCVFTFLTPAAAICQGKSRVNT